MIRRLGVETALTHSQTLNGQEKDFTLFEDFSGM